MRTSFHKYSGLAQRVLFFGRYEATQVGGVSIDTEHILLGIMREQPKLLNQWAILESGLKEEIKARQALGQGKVAINIPLSGQTERALAEAELVRESLGHKVIYPIHLLYGLLKIEVGLGYEVLQEYGLSVAGVEAALGREYEEQEVAAQKGIVAKVGQKLKEIFQPSSNV